MLVPHCSTSLHFNASIFTAVHIVNKILAMVWKLWESDGLGMLTLEICVLISKSVCLEL
jgi:hypothetical protein